MDDHINILYPRFLDINAAKPQDINAIELFSRFKMKKIKFIGFYKYKYPEILNFEGISLDKIIFPPPSRKNDPPSGFQRKISLFLHEIEMFMRYQKKADGIFYASGRPLHIKALKIRKKWQRTPVIITIEGLMGDKASQHAFEELKGHEVFMSPVTTSRMKGILDTADHIFTINPMVKEYLKEIWRRDSIVLPLGINENVFYPKHKAQQVNDRLTVVSAGRVSRLKRPDFFVYIASLFPDCDFFWYGDGPMREQVQRLAAEKGVHNVFFPGSIPQTELAEKMRQADIFAFPSISEGWGKVTQEALACGTPAIVFGYYHTPLIRHGYNGLVAWNDEEFISHLHNLLHDDERRALMGSVAADDAAEMSWDRVAPMWEEKLESLFT